MIRALTLTTAALAASLVAVPAAATEAPPRTGFEQTNGARWTTQPEEQDFLAAVDRASTRVSVGSIGTTKQGRPLQLVRIGAGTPRTRCSWCAASTGTNPPAVRRV